MHIQYYLYHNIQYLFSKTHKYSRQRSMQKNKQVVIAVFLSCSFTAIVALLLVSVNMKKKTKTWLVVFVVLAIHHI